MTEASPRRDCAYCTEPGPDVCVRQHDVASGTGLSVFAHRACAEKRGVPVLYALLGTIRTEHFG